MKLKDKFGEVDRPYEVKLNRRLTLDRLVTDSLGDDQVVFPQSALSSGNPVVYQLLKNHYRYAGVGQIVGVKKFSRLEEVRKDLRPFFKHLQCIATASSRIDLNRKRIEILFRKRGVVLLVQE